LNGTFEESEDSITPNRLQVGDARTPGYNSELNHPAEIVPLDNPSATKVGGMVRARVLVDGRPVAISSL